jgi:hypothetical protein
MVPWLVSLTGKVVVSIISGVVLFLIGLFWRSLVKPIIESSWYSGTRLAPTYQGEFKLDDRVMNDFIEVRQWATKIWGTMIAPSGRQGKYKFEATILDNVLRGTFDGVRTNPRSRGVFLLTLSPGSRDLRGWFVEPYEGKVIALEYKWTPHGS